MKIEKTIEKLKAGKPLTIVALGDSLTYGWMVKKGYLDFLQEMLTEKYPKGKFEIFNRGIPGDTAEGGLHRLKDHVLDMNPDLVFIQFALNDAFIGYPVEQYRNNITAIISKLKQASSCEILLMTSVAPADPHEAGLAEPFYGALMAIAEKEHIPLALVHEYWKKKVADGVTFDKLVQADLVHPTTEGYRLMAEAIMEVF